ncbi:hypothetical protein BZA70DRAFT_270171 [Myxozyma melibiosi]|uniref:Atos-like conserved domain-containing protein n=1 Tax=Myxozyma melibiosi TaxID=54550 RepID=A0ABR1FCV0_9ASCO
MPTVGGSPSSSPPMVVHHARFQRRRQSSFTHYLPHPESLVGSYEESLLAGRTSTPSQKPAVPFVARIGVLGTGDECPAKLRCPRHLSLEFDAVYYNWLGSGEEERGGSPYVGQLDLESHYRETARKQTKSKSKKSKVDGYRIPKTGQIQIVISNPSRTAIKLFLVPYDLSEMPVNTRTFMRQKTYVTDDQQQQQQQSQKKGRLRQAVHLHVVHASTGRYYLFRTLRVVFENRALDTTSTTTTAAPSKSSTETTKVETIMGEFSAYHPEDSTSTSTVRRSSAGRLSGSFEQMEYAVEEGSPMGTSISARMSKLSVSVSAEDLAGLQEPVQKMPSGWGSFM